MLALMFLSSTLFLGDSSNKIQITSQDHNTLYSTESLSWHEWWHSDRGWFLFLSGTSKEEKGLRILLWENDNTLSLVGYTTGREGVSGSKVTLVDQKGDLVLFKGFVNPKVFQFTPQKEYPFERVAIHTNVDAMEVFEGIPVFCSVYAGGKLLPLLEKDASVSLDHINKKLRKDFYHPAQGHSDCNPMLLAAAGKKLAVGYALKNELILFDGNNADTVPLRFRGRIEPPKDFELPKNVRDPFAEWFSRFHHLNKITFFNGELYGYFRQGYSDNGIWVHLTGGDNLFTWNNNNQEIQIIAMGDDEVVLGQKEEAEDGEVTWQLWRSSSLP